MTYLELVNKVLEESGAEKDPLTTGTWSTAESGRRIYTRIKRNVRDAWKTIQMSRGEWEFNTGSLSSLVYPRVKVIAGLRAAGAPPVGTVFVGEESGFSMTLRADYTTGDWVAGTANGNLEFEVYDGTRLIPGEEFAEYTALGPSYGAFVYVEKGSYDFLEVDSAIREIQWSTFKATNVSSAPTPIRYIPWDNWNYSGYFASTQSAPAFASQDYEGKVVFYPQTFNPFRIGFIYNAAPQILSAATDEVLRLPAEYHDWIAWKALMSYAMFDKNPDLFAYAKENEKLYRLRAEKNLMPLISYRASPFNV